MDIKLAKMLLAVGSWQLAVGSWQLAVGYWQLANGSWLLYSFYIMVFGGIFMNIFKHQVPL